LPAPCTGPIGAHKGREELGRAALPAKSTEEKHENCIDFPVLVSAIEKTPPPKWGPGALFRRYITYVFKQGTEGIK
jgi:hypothetical protein